MINGYLGNTRKSNCICKPNPLWWSFGYG